MTETARLAQLLASRLKALWGAAAEITGIQRLPGGASRESWGVQARMTDGTEHRLILLRDPGRSDRHRDVAVEAAAMVAARAAGVPAPELYDHGEEALGPGRAYLLMERLDGETIRTRLCGPGSRAVSGRSWPGSTR
jgi:aminoglycoside phosphotransferase (APT) family kinase protein